VFYESLLAQRPSSEMALTYCVEHGILTTAVLEGGMYQMYLKLRNKKSPAQMPVPAAAKAKPAPKKRKAADSDDE
jgi:hypothetical protein